MHYVVVAVALFAAGCGSNLHGARRDAGLDAGTPPADGAAPRDGAAPNDGAIAAPDLNGAAADGAPARVCDVLTYGAAGDGAHKDTAALQAAIDDCATTGGIVLVHDGIFLSGTITLRAHVTLRIAVSATLLGSTDIADYADRAPPVQNTQLSNCKKALVYAESADDIAIDGGGTIDGNAAAVASWNGDQIPEGMRPMAIFTALSTHVTIEDVKVRNAGVWAVVNLEATHLVLRGLDVDNQLGATHDGLDIVDGHDVLVEDCTVRSGDDSICLKSGSASGTIGVTVRNCHTAQSGVANGVKLGTASVGPFRDITIENVLVENAQAAALAVESVDGSAISNLAFSHITVSNVGTPFFVLLGSRNLDPKQVGSIDGVSFSDIRGSNLRYAWGSIVTGSVVGAQTFSLGDVSFSGIHLVYKGAGAPAMPTPFTADSFPEYQGFVSGNSGARYDQYPDAKFFTGTNGNENTSYCAPGFAFFVRHAKNVTFSDCHVSTAGSDSRAWSGVKDVSGLSGSCSP